METNHSLTHKNPHDISSRLFPKPKMLNNKYFDSNLVAHILLPLRTLEAKVQGEFFDDVLGTP